MSEKFKTHPKQQKSLSDALKHDAILDQAKLEAHELMNQLDADDLSENLKFNSWDEINEIADPGDRVKHASLFAIRTNMDCFTDDGNHCNGWADSVFNKAGLETLYASQNRIFVSPKHPHWRPRGSLTGVDLRPGDAITYYNGNDISEIGAHTAIVTKGAQIDQQGNYILNVAAQTWTNKAAGTGDRENYTVTIPAKDILVVVRPSNPSLNNA